MGGNAQIRIPAKRLVLFGRIVLRPRIIWEVNASPYGHEFYKKLGFVDTSEEQITNGVRYYPMERK